MFSLSDLHIFAGILNWSYWLVFVPWFVIKLVNLCLWSKNKERTRLYQINANGLEMD